MWLKSELLNIKNGQHWAAQNVEDENAGLLCLLYPLLGPALLEHYVPPTERFEWLEPALRLVDRFPQYDSESSLLILKGRAYVAQGLMQEALAVFQRTLEQARAVADERTEAFALSNLGVAQFCLGESAPAIDSLNGAITMWRNLRNDDGVAQVRGDLGNVYYFLGEYQRATELFEQRLAFAEETNNVRHKVGALLSLGLTHSAAGRFRDALETHELALCLSREIGDLQAEGEILANLSNVYAVLGENERGLETSERRLVIAREIGDVRGEGKTLFNQGVMYRELGQNEQAIGCGLEAIQILHRMGDPYVVRMRKQIREWQAGPKRETEHLVEADPIVTLRLEASMRYDRQLKQWKSLPWWKRLITKRPEFPSGFVH